MRLRNKRLLLIAICSSAGLVLAGEPDVQKPGTNLIQNPVLRGFHPDPSIVRVGEDFYIASSTFEWLPGVRFHHSRDLVHWKVAGHALTRPAHIDLKGVQSSGGSWAPSLSYADGKFWLIYTNVRTSRNGMKDSHVYLTTAPAIEGPWSDPVHLNSIGFDPSLFHDDDGRKWLLNMQWDFRAGYYRFAGICLQEYDPVKQRLVGESREILRKEKILCEGPNLYKRDGWYYLMMAEGGTSWGHAITMARSKNIAGPYELDPQQAVLTTRRSPDFPLQKAGHGELVETEAGEWWLAFLCSRPLRTPAPAPAGADAEQRTYAGMRCMLGRETGLQRVVWSDDGWLRLVNGTMRPDVEVAAPAGLPAHPWPAVPERDDFEGAELGLDWASLRVLADPSWLSLSERPGWLRLYGRESPQSLHEQSLVAKRLQEFKAVAETRIDFSPTRYTQMAGLMAWYDTRTFYFLRVTHDEKLGKILRIMVTDNDAYSELYDSQCAINDWPAVYLRAEIDHEALQFSASPDGTSWQPIGPVLDASKLSDDYGSYLHFTGAFLGLASYDLAGQGGYADFDYFRLECSKK
jgi:xylan 1,4-beta-xylosidase